MINLDKVIEQGVELQLSGKKVTVKQLTIKEDKEIDKLQSEMNDKNAYEKRKAMTLALINNNKEGIKFTDDDVDKIPIKLQVEIHNQINKFVYDLVSDPN